MTVIATIEAAAIVLIVLLFLRYRASEHAATALERRELLNRIQHPEIMPVQAVENFEIPEPEIDESALVGSIDYGTPDA